MSGISVGISSVWKTMNNLSLGVGGAWKQVEKVSIGVGGVWKDVWQHLSVAVTSISAFDTSLSPSDSTATISIVNDGTITATGTGGGTWLVAGTVAQVEVYLSGSGDALASGTLNTWMSCSTTRSWTLTNTTNGANTKTWSGTMQWRDATSLAVLDTAPVDLEATVDV